MASSASRQRQASAIVGRIYECFELHVRKYRLGRIVVSPVDVILDRDRHLVVQPDVVFVASERLEICTDRIWGSPDLVVEGLSAGNARHDRITKVGWYRQYGVRECWLVDIVSLNIEVIDLAAPDQASRIFGDRRIVRSVVAAATASPSGGAV